jgi:hypothetical protein
VLLEIIVTLVVNSEEVPHILRQLGIEDMVQGRTVKCCHDLQLGLLVTSGPFKVGLSIRGCQGRVDPSTMSHKPLYLSMRVVILHHCV